MVPVLKSFLKCLAFAFVSFVAGGVCEYPIVGIFVGMIPVMVGFLWLWDYVDQASKDCWWCGRTQLNGRYMHTNEWFDHAHAGAECDRCREKLVQPGDKLFGNAISRKAA